MSVRVVCIALLISFVPVGEALAQGFMPLTPGTTSSTAAASAADTPAVQTTPPSATPPTRAQQLPDAGAIYTDPSGNFRAPIPAGWTTKQPGDGSVQITQGPAWIVLVPVAAMRPQDAAEAVIAQIGNTYKLVKGNESSARVSGHPIYYAVFRGQSPQQQPVAMMVAGIQAPSGHVLAFISSAPLDSVNNFSPALLQIMQGIRFAGE